MMESSFVGIDVFVHEGQQAPLKVFALGREFKGHGSLLWVHRESSAIVATNCKGIEQTKIARIAITATDCQE
jgi:hypothetical protein